MRRIRYVVATTLDGYIAGPNGEADWIFMDPAIDFNAIFLFAAVPLAILVSRLPISIDGIGVYEGIFIAIMTLGGVRPDDSLAISLAMRALQIVAWLPWWLAMAVQTHGVRPPSNQETLGNEALGNHRAS